MKNRQIRSGESRRVMGKRERKKGGGEKDGEFEVTKKRERGVDKW